MASTEFVTDLAYKFKVKWKKLIGLIFLRNKEITIISNNCIGGALYHDYKLQFNSPFINVNISMEHYLQICRNLKEYMQAELQEVQVNDQIQEYFTKNLRGGAISFPVGKLVIGTGETALIFFSIIKLLRKAKRLGSAERRE